MRKAEAIDLLGGTVASAASAIGITFQAVDKWPDELPARIEDRVLAAWVRKNIPERLPASALQPPVEARHAG